jgi:hypothetical protein
VAALVTSMPIVMDAEPDQKTRQKFMVRPDKVYVVDTHQVRSPHDDPCTLFSYLVPQTFVLFFLLSSLLIPVSLLPRMFHVPFFRPGVCRLHRYDNELIAYGNELMAK